jgi:hypothetical protein
MTTEPELTLDPASGMGALSLDEAVVEAPGAGSESRSDHAHVTANRAQGHRGTAAAKGELHNESVPHYSQRVLDAGFLFALGLSLVTFLGTLTYLFYNMVITNRSIASATDRFWSGQGTDASAAWTVNSMTLLAQIGLRGSGLLVGLALGFLGFALFLVGVKGEMDMNASSQPIRVKVSRMSPGVFVIVCATVVIGLSITHSLTTSTSIQPVAANSPATAGPDPANIPGPVSGAVPAPVLPATTKGGKSK